jgi:uncharacterized membrane protein
VAFGSPAGGFVLASLVAVSPFHVHLSRQAREYELISTFALGSSALLLWALAGPTPAALVGVRALCLALGLYTDPLFAGVIAAHGITVVATQRTRAALGSFLAACAAALLAFAPWAAVLLAERASAHAQLDWLAGTYPLKFFAEKWLFNFGTVAFDAELRDLRLAVVVAAFALLVAFAAVRCGARRGGRSGGARRRPGPEPQRDSAAGLRRVRHRRKGPLHDGRTLFRRRAPSASS